MTLTPEEIVFIVALPFYVGLLIGTFVLGYK